MTVIDVLIADDQMLVRTGLAMVIGADPAFRVVGEAADGVQAVRLAHELHPDVVLMDLRMPRLDGIEATRRIATEVPETRVIALTTFDLDEYAFGALNAGASGFLLKDVSSELLVQAIVTVASGDAIVSPRVTQRMIEVTRGTLPTATAAAPELDGLTDREREVLVAIGAGRSNSEIAAQLFLSESTVKTHVGRVLAKLQLRDRVHAVIYAYDHGLVGPAR
jgi:DNA-binding NarL/FixJ family response regulator